MENKRLASLPLSKEVLDRTPQKVIELLLRLLSRVDEPASRLQATVLSGSGDEEKIREDIFFRCAGVML